MATKCLANLRENGPSSRRVINNGAFQPRTSQLLQYWDPQPHTSGQTISTERSATSNERSGNLNGDVRKLSRAVTQPQRRRPQPLTSGRATSTETSPTSHERSRNLNGDVPNLSRAVTQPQRRRPQPLTSGYATSTETSLNPHERSRNLNGNVRKLSRAVTQPQRRRPATSHERSGNLNEEVPQPHASGHASSTETSATSEKGAIDLNLVCPLDEWPCQAQEHP
jgi:hypothetical protein